MKVERWQQISTIFEGAADRPVETRGAYLRLACGDDTELRSHVEALLGNYSTSDECMESPPVELFRLLLEASDGSLFQPGDMVADRFRVVGLLGHGGMGEVYETEDTALRNLRVALKTVRSHLVSDETARRRFARELELARGVTHTNVCRVYDMALHRLPIHVADTVDLIVLSMELLPGVTLAGRIRGENRLSVPETLTVAKQIVEGLAAAHMANVVHGDFKPNNV